MRTTHDLSGSKFGMLTVLKAFGKDKHGNTIWECLCDCGNKAFPVTRDLVSSHSTSCGCVRGVKIGDFKRTHGESRTKLYKTWQDMKARCYNPNNTYFNQYGGRGISVCDSWIHNYTAFKEWANSNGYSDGLTLDRIDVNGDYEPSNCRWATQYQQANNRTSNRFVTYHGEVDTLTNMCRKLNMNYSIIKARITRSGCSFEQAVDNYPNTSAFVEYWKNHPRS